MNVPELRKSSTKMKSLSRLVLEDILERENLVVIDKSRLDELVYAERMLRIHEKHHSWRPKFERCGHYSCELVYVSNGNVYPSDAFTERDLGPPHCATCKTMYCDLHVAEHMEKVGNFPIMICFDCLEKEGRISPVNL